MDEAESPYDNMQPALAGQDGDGAEPSPGEYPAGFQWTQEDRKSVV